jgi:hypothetical protein
VVFSGVDGGGGRGAVVLGVTVLHPDQDLDGHSQIKPLAAGLDEDEGRQFAQV